MCNIIDTFYLCQESANNHFQLARYKEERLAHRMNRVTHDDHITVNPATLP